MIIGIGIDSVEIYRFEHWRLFSEKKLLRLFSKNEIVYCCSNYSKSAERFAVRFAAREACFKAFSQAFSFKIPFLTFCKLVEIKKNNEIPSIAIDWQSIWQQLSLIKKKQNIQCHLSLNHSKTIATAFCLLETKKK